MSNLEQQVKDLTAKVQELTEIMETMTAVQIHHSEAHTSTLAYLQQHKLEHKLTDMFDEKLNS